MEAGSARIQEELGAHGSTGSGHDPKNLRDKFLAPKSTSRLKTMRANQQIERYSSASNGSRIKPGPQLVQAVSSDEELATARTFNTNLTKVKIDMIEEVRRQQNKPTGNKEKPKDTV